MKDKDYLVEMYRDKYYPVFLVDKVTRLLKEVASLLATGEQDLTMIQAELDKAIIGINDLQEAFDVNGSEIETVARESIAETVALILSYYKIDIEVEEAVRERDW